jgi:putative ABC transport system permease protein
MKDESIQYSLRNIKHRKTRSFLTVFSILIGIATIFIFISFGYGLYNYIGQLSSSSSANKLIIQSKGGISGLDENFKLDDDDLAVVNRAAGVMDATGLYVKSAEVVWNNERIYASLLAFDPKKPLMIEVSNIEIASGRELSSGDSGKVVLGYNYQISGKIFKKEVKLNDNIEIQGKKLKVVGFYNSVGNPADDSQVYIINDYVNILYPGNNSYTWIIAEADLKEVVKAKENIEKGLIKSRNLEEGKEDFYVQSFEDMIESYSSALDIVIAFIILIALISVLVSAINTANTMITSVIERYKEIGILKAIGAKNSEILKIFLFESSFLGFIAGCIGVIVGFVGTYIGGAILANVGFGFLKPYYNFWLFFGCIVFATLTGAISGVLPAIRASKINPVDALRYE